MLDIINALDNNIIPWKEIDVKTNKYWVFKDGKSRDMFFVPTKNDFEHLTDAYKAAYKFGFNGIDLERWEGFEIKQTVRNTTDSPEYVNYPYVRLIFEE